MNAPTVSLVVLSFVFGGALVGMFLRGHLPREHLSAESHRVIVSSTGLIITMSGIVVGMLVTTAKNTFDATQNQISQLSSNVVALDSLLASFGPAGQEARAQLRFALQTGMERVWPEGQSRVQVDLNQSNELDVVYKKVLALSPANEEEAVNKAEAIRLASGLSLRLGYSFPRPIQR
jgi:NADH:ubiquinone oxidoreductase subunit 5 (subunit L)/multisubunit Na+/H+ antiporter MnhA subunit